jgi:hypothetical protein
MKNVSCAGKNFIIDCENLHSVENKRFQPTLEVGLMAKLTDLGFSKGAIVETIVTTYNRNGEANAAPMGTIMWNDQTVLIRLNTTSLTHKNLKASKCAVVNITSDIDLFYRTTFKEANPKGKMPKEWFEKAETVNAPKLRAAEATIEVTLAKTAQIDAERTEVACKVEMIKATKVLPKAYCRAFSATMEAIIHATRVKALIHAAQEQERVSKLLETIENCKDIVNRTAPSSRYTEIMADLAEKISSWRISK